MPPLGVFLIKNNLEIKLSMTGFSRRDARSTADIKLKMCEGYIDLHSIKSSFSLNYGTE